MVLPQIPLAAKFSLLLALLMLPALGVLSWLDRDDGTGVFAAALKQGEDQLAGPVGDFLARSYGVAGNWNFVPRSPLDFHDWLEENVQEGGAPPPRRGAAGYGRPGGPPGGPRRESLFHLERRIALLDADGRLLVGPPGAAQARGRWPIRLDGNTIGALTFIDADIVPPPGATTDQSAANRHLALVALGGLLAVLLASWLLARHLLRPVRQFATAASALAEGAGDTRLAETRRDEFAELARSFNNLAEKLDANERERRRFVADTSHELRTPITVLRAQIEALQDGIHQADSGTLAVLHQDVMGLSRLVDDLYALARADAGALKVETAPIDIPAILDEVAEGFEPRLNSAGLTCEISGRPETPWICLGDQRRIRQLFINLIENSVRYTDRGGKLAIWLNARANTLVIRFDDSAPGVPDESLPRLFERFYRVEASRNRDQGGSGLGLAVCQGIVAAHGGQITASASPLGGLRIEIVLPRGEERRP